MRKLTPMVWYSILLVTAALLALVLPPNPETLADLQISASGYRLALAVLIIPYAALWYAGFYVYAKVQEYSHYVHKSKEGEAFRRISRGLGILAFGLVVPLMLDLAIGFAAQKQPVFSTLSKLGHHYYTLLFMLVAITYISDGSDRLVERIKVRARMGSIRWFAVVFVLLSTIYSYLVLHNYRVNQNPYDVGLALILLTIIAPHLYVWFLGISSALELNLYAVHVQGLIYQRALALFAKGIVVVITGAIASQFIESTVAVHQSNIWYVLLYEFLPLLLLIIGFGLMAAGAKKLKRIEEV
jgi:hypothetical protein